MLHEEATLKIKGSEILKEVDKTITTHEEQAEDDVEWVTTKENQAFIDEVEKGGVSVDSDKDYYFKGDIYTEGGENPPLKILDVKFMYSIEL